jgi:hypothetical protein
MLTIEERSTGRDTLALYATKAIGVAVEGPDKCCSSLSSKAPPFGAVFMGCDFLGAYAPKMSEHRTRYGEFFPIPGEPRPADKGTLSVNMKYVRKANI